MKLVLLLMAFVAITANAATPLNNQAEVNAAFAKHRPMVIMFSAAWCPACRLTYPQYLEAEKTFKGKVDFYYMDSDKISLKMARQYGGIPAFVCGKTEREIRSAKSLIEGGMPAEGIIDYVNKCIR